MPRDIICPADSHESKSPYSPAVRANGFVFVSGQASVDAQGNIIHDTFEAEFRRSMENVKKILAAAGLTLDDVVSVRSYVAKQEDLAQYNQLYREYFAKPFPARTTLIECLGTVVKFEIDVVAVERPKKFKASAKAKPALKAKSAPKAKAALKPKTKSKSSKKR